MSKLKKIIEDAQPNPLRSVRKEFFEMTQAEAGLFLGVSDSTVNRIEAGTFKDQEKLESKIEMFLAISKLIQSHEVDRERIKELIKIGGYTVELVYFQLVHEKIIGSVPGSVDPRGILCSADSGLRLNMANMIKQLKNDDVDYVVQRLKRSPGSINDTDSKGYTALMEAAYKGYLKISELLIRMKADINHKVPRNDSNEARAIFDKNKGVDPNWGSTALNLVFMSDNKSEMNDRHQIAESLLKAGADVNSLSELGQTPLSIAAGNGFPVETLNLLISHGADLNSTANLGTGCTPMMSAILYEQFEQARFLIEAGTGLDIQDSKGLTALHYAAVQDAEDIVKLLLDKGADKSIKNKRGETPADLARKLKSSALKLLE